MRIPSRLREALARAKAHRIYTIRTLLTAALKYRRERTPAAREALVAVCREVVAADDRLESLGAARG